MKWFKRSKKPDKRNEPVLNDGLKERFPASINGGPAEDHESPTIASAVLLDSVSDEEKSSDSPSGKSATRPSPFAGLSKKTGAQPKKNKPQGNGASVKSIVLGVPFGNADLWMSLSPQGEGTRLSGLPAADMPTPAFASSRVFRMALYDKGILFPKKLSGKALRNAMIREKDINDVPASITAHHLRWFTRKSTVEIHERPVHPLAASLFAFAQKQGWHPQEGILLRIAIPMQESTLWIYLALGKTGIGIPQTAIIPNESDRPSYNMSLSSGILPKEHATHDIAPEVLYNWLSSGKHLRYPQASEWLGLPMAQVGKVALVLGLLLSVIGGGVWVVGQSQLASAKSSQKILQMESAHLSQVRAAFLRKHLFLIAHNFEIPLHQDIVAASLLWKPGTQVVLSDGMPLQMGGGTGNALIPMPNAAAQPSSHTAQIAISIPETKNSGSGQTSWVSNALLGAVISQPSVDGFSLQSIQNQSTGGNGYVVIFSRSR